MFYVYVIQSLKTGKIYIGQTQDINKRIKRHNQELKTKPTTYTKRNQGPWKLVYKEGLKTREEATKRERELKSFQGRRFIKDKILKAAQR